jgi:1-deoxy-D-xylulose-5-phosphate reductoisomerase
MKKRIAVLGATGSIGKSSLDVISRDKENFEAVLLSAHTSFKELEELSRLWPSAICVLSSNMNNGREKLVNAIKEAQADIVINGISGAAGLEPSLAAIEAGSTLALANKETVVMAAPLVFRLAKEKNVKIIPVDSEHSAIFKLIESHTGNTPTAHCSLPTAHCSLPTAHCSLPTAHCSLLTAHCSLLTAHCSPLPIISEIILTASGGPFRKLSLEEMKKVTPQQALAHPTWNMGPKITIDSASMANKGLEIIEACALFNMPPEKITVTIHPQSIVHSMIRLCNGVVYAQLSKPDMRHPIHDALYWPETSPSTLENLNFDSLTLEFEKPDNDKFPMLKLARQAAQHGKLYPCAYNAVNEEAVNAFLNQKIGFLDMARITEGVLSEDWALECDSIETVLNADKKAREKAIFHIEKIV